MKKSSCGLAAGLAAGMLLLALSASALAIDFSSSEPPITRWTDGSLSIQARPLIVTSSNPPTGGDRIAIAGDTNTSSGVNVDGVARLFLDVDPAPNFGALCTGTLLESGQHILTAAHCVSDRSGNNAVIDNQDGNSVTFLTAGGAALNFPFNSVDITVHPSFDGDLLHGYDVAVIDLGVPVPATVPRYGINTDLSLEDTAHLAVGFGQSGDGGTGALLAAGTKRTGNNIFEAYGLPSVAIITNHLTQLTADFDSGVAANDAFDYFFGVPDLGFGSDEVAIAPGDSGGPAFVFSASNEPLIAGVHSYALRLEFTDTTTSDVDGTINSSFGEFYVDARVANAEIESFITMTIPEPSGFGLLMVGLCLWRVIAREP